MTIRSKPLSPTLAELAAPDLEQEVMFGYYERSADRIQYALTRHLLNLDRLMSILDPETQRLIAAHFAGEPAPPESPDSQ
jgi:hypothetical protein